MSQAATPISAPAAAAELPAQRIGSRAWMVAAVFAALLIRAFWPTFGWMYERWIEPGSYYSHGFYVPFVALYFIWRDRYELRRAAAGHGGEAPPHTGPSLAIMIAGLAGLLVSGFLTVYFTAGFSLILTIWGLCGFIFGARVLRRLAFPMFILAFMMPLPLETIAGLSLRLKLMASALAMRLMDLGGMLATNDGSTIYLGNGATVIVGDACSGLRSLISLLFLSVIFTALSNLTPPRKVALFILSMPIAIAANVMRVFFLCVVAARWGSQSIEGTVHDTSGYMIFLVAFFLLYGASLALRWKGGARARPSEAVHA